jgi:hypothetical protein
VYNFCTRKYEAWRGDGVEDGGIWSDVEYCPDERCNQHAVIWDAWGNMFYMNDASGEAVGEHHNNGKCLSCMQETEVW